MESIFGTFRSVDPATVDHVVLLDQISWARFLSIARTRDASGRRNPRLHYLDGTLQLMATSEPHEYIKTTLARCLEAWAEHVDIDLHGVGAFTIRNRAALCAAEADESYFVGSRGQRPPDLAIEVVWTHGGLEKLDVYRGLGVREVWIWEDGTIGVHVFERGKWVRRTRSSVLPDVDVALLERCVKAGDQPKALRMLRAALKH